VKDDASMNDITDTQLLEYLDGQLTDAEKAAMDARITSAPEVAARLEMLRRRTARLTMLLADVSPNATHVQRSGELIRPQITQTRSRMLRIAAWSPGLKAAAAVALLLGLALAVAPVRAWILERTRDAAQALGMTRNEPAVNTAPPVTPAVPAIAPQEADVRITFAVTRDTFNVELPQGSGTLIVRRLDNVTGTAEAFGVPGASFIVLPGSLRIEGPAATANAVYELTLPMRVRAVRLRRADSSDSVHLLHGAGQDLSIDLSSERR
jgi:hypothetical protein